MTSTDDEIRQIIAGCMVGPPSTQKSRDRLAADYSELLELRERLAAIKAILDDPDVSVSGAMQAIFDLVTPAPTHPARTAP